MSSIPFTEWGTLEFQDLQPNTIRGEIIAQQSSRIHLDPSLEASDKSTAGLPHQRNGGAGEPCLSFKGSVFVDQVLHGSTTISKHGRNGEV